MRNPVRYRARFTDAHVGQVRVVSARGALLDVGNDGATAMSSMSNTRSVRGGMAGGRPLAP